MDRQTYDIIMLIAEHILRDRLKRMYFVHAEKKRHALFDWQTQSWQLRMGNRHICC